MHLSELQMTVGHLKKAIFVLDMLKSSSSIKIIGKKGKCFSHLAI